MGGKQSRNAINRLLSELFGALAISFASMLLFVATAREDEDG